MLKRPTSGSIVCPTCGRLVGVRDEKCLGCGRTNPGMWGLAPILQRFGRDFGFAELVIGICGTLYVLTILYDPKAALEVRSILAIGSPSTEATIIFGASGAAPILLFDRWWTVLSAAWLHGGIIHIGFNMMWIRQLAPAVGNLFGLGRLLIIYTVSSIAGFALTSFVFMMGLQGGPLGFLGLSGAGLTLGASASLCGLFGALLLYGQKTGNSQIVDQIKRFAIFILVLGIVIPGIDNLAHIGGFVGGYLCARILDPLRAESPQTLLVGLVCLGANLLAIVAAVVHGLSIRPVIQAWLLQ